MLSINVFFFIKHFWFDSHHLVLQKYEEKVYYACVLSAIIGSAHSRPHKKIHNNIGLIVLQSKAVGFGFDLGFDLL